jgi:Na+(H+)/acetate symporter ActP
VLQCVKHLVLLGVAVLVPAFQYSNIYRPTPKLKQLAKSPDVQQRAIAKCSKSELKKAKIRDILLLFASMTHGATLGELCVRFNPAKKNIDERKTVLFGLVEQLIRPIFKYPVAVNKNLFVGYEEMTCHQQQQQQHNIIDIDSYGIPISKKRPSVDNVKVAKNSFTGLKTLGELWVLFWHHHLDHLVYFFFLDEICMRTASSTRQLEEQLACDKHVIVLLK